MKELTRPRKWIFQKTKKNSSPAVILSKAEQTLLVDAIREAELSTSGEIKVHIERKCPKPVMERATEVFNELELYNTVQRNGVLIYLAEKDHVFAILGDAGIHEKVGQHYWEDISSEMVRLFQSEGVMKGLQYGIRSVGEKLKDLFPYQDGDINEISDDISLG